MKSHIYSPLRHFNSSFKRFNVQISKDFFQNFRAQFFHVFWALSFLNIWNVLKWCHAKNIFKTRTFSLIYDRAFHQITRACDYKKMEELFTPMEEFVFILQHIRLAHTLIWPINRPANGRKVRNKPNQVKKLSNPQKYKIHVWKVKF